MFPFQSLSNQNHKQEQQNVALLVMQLNNWIVEQQRTALEAFDLSLPQFNVLRILSNSYPKPLSTAKIREKMSDKMSDTSRIVDRLISKELAQKYPSRYDRRLVDVLITKKGKGLLDLIEKSKHHVDGYLDVLSDTEVDMLNEICGKLRAAKNSGDLVKQS
jgi:DNA-binding MarR family transcriptional regulator